MNSKLQCDTCDQQFARREHLDRHIRTHTKEKPCQCPFCDRRFTRTDSQYRHMKAYHNDLLQRAPKRRRTIVACDACRTNKAKCDTDQTPCARCRIKGISCTYTIRSSQPPAQGSPDSDAPQTAFNGDSEMIETSNHGLQNEPTPTMLQESPITLISEPSQSPLVPSAATQSRAPLSESSSPDLSIESTRADLQPDLVLSVIGEESQFLVTPNQNFKDDTLTYDGSPVGISYSQTSQDLNEAQESTFTIPEAAAEDLNFEGFVEEIYRSFESQFFRNPNVENYHVVPSSEENSMFMMARPTSEDDNNCKVNVPLANATPRSHQVAAAYTRLHELASAASYVSRPSSPLAVTEHQRWLTSLGSEISPKFDRDIINVFLGLFQCHLGDFFPGMKRFRIFRDTPEDLYLAMAAVGGLYCTTPGAARVAGWFSHNARKQLLTRVHGADTVKPITRIATIQTYMLLEVFGYLCGEERAYELVEVWHSDMLQVAQNFTFLAPHQYQDRSGRDEYDKTHSNLIKSLYVLESYRVVLLQRPPIFYPCIAPQPAMTTSSSSSCKSTPACVLGPRDDELSKHLQSITSMNSPDLAIESHSMSMQSLCAISLLASQATYRATPWSQNEDHTGHKDHCRALFDGKADDGVWRETYIELILDNWHRAHAKSIVGAPRMDTMMLFHLIHLNLYASLQAIQAIAQRTLNDINKKKNTFSTNGNCSQQQHHHQRRQGQQTPLPESGLLPKAQIWLGGTREMSFLRCFRLSDDDDMNSGGTGVEKALWHASCILRLGEQLILDKSEQDDEGIEPQGGGGSMGRSNNKNNNNKPKNDINTHSCPAGYGSASENPSLEFVSSSKTNEHDSLPPHFAHSIFLASLCFWCACKANYPVFGPSPQARTNSNNDSRGGCGSYYPCHPYHRRQRRSSVVGHADSVATWEIRLGHMILARLRAPPVAKVFGRVLEQLLDVLGGA